MAGLPKIGDALGAYIVRGHLGEGGMGLVYLAEHARLSRKVALKLLRPELVVDPVSVQRFFAEARAVNAIGHENIVEITDFVDEGEHQYFVMELLKGKGLLDLVREGPIEVPRAVHIAGQLAMALAAAHEAGIVHRDLKPGNIYLIPRGRDRDFVKLLDFGVAKVAEAAAEDVVKTQAGMVVGTPAYLAPETLQAPPGDHRVDIYALGVLLFEMTLGYRPFKGSIGELMRCHLFEPPPRPSEVAPGFPPALEALILRCLAKAPADRPASMQQVGDALLGIAEDCGPFRADSAELSGTWAYPGTGGFEVAAIDFIADDAVMSLDPQPAPVEDLFADGTPHTGETSPPVSAGKGEGDPALPGEGAHDEAQEGDDLPSELASDVALVSGARGGGRVAMAAGGVAALVLVAGAYFALAGEEEAALSPPVVEASAAPLPAVTPEPPAAVDAEQQHEEPGAEREAEPAEDDEVERLAAVDVTAAAAAEHEIEVTSKPEGAVVFLSPTTGDAESRRTQTRRLGVTPLLARVPEGAPVLFTLRHDGYQPAYVRVTPAPGARVAQALTRVEPAAKKPSLKEGAIRNPFAAKKRK